LALRAAIVVTPTLELSVAAAPPRRLIGTLEDKSRLHLMLVSAT
jgi:hypothetical protein